MTQGLLVVLSLATAYLLGQFLGFGAAVIGAVGIVACLTVMLNSAIWKRLAGWGLACFAFSALVGLGTGSLRKSEKEAPDRAAQAELEQKMSRAATIQQLASAPPEALYTLCVQADESGGLPPNQRARCGTAFFEAGQAAASKGDTSAARTLLAKAIAFTPNDAKLQPVAKATIVRFAIQDANEGLKLAEERLAANDTDGALHAAGQARNEADEALKLDRSNEILKTLKRRAESELDKIHLQKKKVGAPARQAYANAFEHQLRDEGVDANVRATGPAGQTLYIQHVGCGRVELNAWFVRAASKTNVVDAFQSGVDGREIPNRNAEEARHVGFKKVVCGDGSGTETWIEL